MKTLVLILAVVTISYGYNSAIRNAVGSKDVALKLSGEPVKQFVRKLKDGSVQKWDVDGANKGQWVDANGKKIDSSNYTYKAPGTLVIKRLTATDEGLYKSVPVTAPPKTETDSRLTTDEFQEGIELSTFSI